MDQLVALEQTITATPPLNVYRWWEPHMQLPCLWNELSGESRSSVVDACRVEDFVRVDVSLVGPPRPDHEQSMLDVEDVIDAAIVALDGSLMRGPVLGGTVSSGRRLGVRTGTEKLGAETHLAFTLPLELKLVRTYP